MNRVVLSFFFILATVSSNAATVDTLDYVIEAAEESQPMRDTVFDVDLIMQLAAVNPLRQSDLALTVGSKPIVPKDPLLYSLFFSLYQDQVGLLQPDLAAGVR